MTKINSERTAQLLLSGISRSVQRNDSTAVLCVNIKDMLEYGGGLHCPRICQIHNAVLKSRLVLSINFAHPAQWMQMTWAWSHCSLAWDWWHHYDVIKSFFLKRITTSDAIGQMAPIWCRRTCRTDDIDTASWIIDHCVWVKWHHNDATGHLLGTDASLPSGTWMT